MFSDEAGVDPSGIAGVSWKFPKYIRIQFKEISEQPCNDLASVIG